MTDVKTICIEQPRWGTARVAVHHTIIWSFLVGAEGVSHWWFGGSWVVDLMILVCLITIIYGTASKAAGTRVSMTPDQIRRWVADGMPMDIKEWKTGQD